MPPPLYAPVEKNEEMPFLKQLFLHSNMHVPKAWFNGLIRLSLTDSQELLMKKYELPSFTYELFPATPASQH